MSDNISEMDPSNSFGKIVDGVLPAPQADLEDDSTTSTSGELDIHIEEQENKSDNDFDTAVEELYAIEIGDNEEDVRISNEADFIEDYARAYNYINPGTWDFEEETGYGIGWGPHEPEPQYEPHYSWGMDLTEDEFERLQIEQERIFGHIQDDPTEPLPFECVCGEASADPAQFVHLTCQDNCVRCPECLNSNVRIGLESKRSYPPMCCVPIDFENVITHLEPDLINRWLEVAPEYSDLAPVYCATNTCSKYLPKSAYTEQGDWAQCDKCNVKTCTSCLCLESQHEDPATCPERLDKLNQELVEREGWKACPACSELIEKTDGCDHMTCNCGENFCYACGTSYSLRCNCRGEDDWGQQLDDDADPARQQEILDEIAERNRIDEENHQDGWLGDEQDNGENLGAEDRDDEFEGRQENGGNFEDEDEDHGAWNNTTGHEPVSE